MERKTELASFGVELSKLELHTAKGQRTLVGYASAFNYPIPEQHGGNMFFEPGAWTRTLNNNRDQIQVLFHHGMDPEIGEKPLGVPAVMRQDAHGLWTETPLAKTRYNEETIIPLLESGALRSMSVQFAAIEAKHASDGRHVSEAKLKEFGPTPFPANLGASAALHSASMADFLAMDGESPDNLGDEENQPESPADAARLTWSMNAMRSLEGWERDQELLAERIARLEGSGHDQHLGAHQGAAR